MVTLVLLALAGVAVAVVVAGLVRAGRREARAEQIRRQEEERHQARRSPAAVWKMNGAQFEEYVAGLCRRDGCTQVQRVGGAGDLGADVIGFLPDGRKLVIQCKRYVKHRSVGSRDLQTFNGTARDEHGADVPVFVASCVFTQQARAFAARRHVVLIDVNLLGFWHGGTPLSAFLDLDIGRSGNHRKIAADD
ncbi:restriction endonuclease [Streptomyces sp. NPDC018019]|uniref:restriction endonuclease n=1 Tax=Streptomyces sp. NPDC018019 TaxID=3365030 RepID=UPI0037B5E6ED